MKQMGELLASREWVDWTMDLQFAWAPSGRRSISSARFAAPEMFGRWQWIRNFARREIERLTTGPGT